MAVSKELDVALPAGALIGYARVSTDKQDLAVQRGALEAMGVPEDLIYVDHGLTGRNRDRPGLEAALKACRPGDTLVVTKLDRLARSIRDASAIADELQAKKVKLSLGGSVHDPADPLGRMVFSMMAVFAEFEADLARMRTREGMQAAKAKGRLRGRQPKLKPSTEKTLVQMWHAGSHTQKELADTFGVSRTTVIRAVARAGDH